MKKEQIIVHSKRVEDRKEEKKRGRNSSDNGEEKKLRNRDWLEDVTRSETRDKSKGLQIDKKEKFQGKEWKEKGEKGTTGKDTNRKRKVKKITINFLPTVAQT